MWKIKENTRKSQEMTTAISREYSLKYLLYDSGSAGAFHKNWPKLIPSWPKHKKRVINK